MLGWLFPATCPVDDETRRWVERRARWIVETYPHLLGLPVRLPLREDFPDPFDGTPDSGVALFERVRGYLGLADEGIRIAFYSEGDGLDDLRLEYGGRTSSSGTAGQFNPHGGGFRGGEPTVWINTDSLCDQLTLTATLAHELGHIVLLVPPLPGSDEDDHEPLTDLVTIFSGFGVLTANTITYKRSRTDGASFSWTVGRLGYLSAEIAGYALALYAALRGDPKPDWRTHLDTDPRAFFEQSRRYLAKRFPHGLTADALEE